MKKTSPAIEMTLSAGRPAAYDTTGFDPACGEADRIAQKDKEIAAWMEKVDYLKSLHAERIRGMALSRLRAMRDAEESKAWAWRSIFERKRVERTRERDIACAVNRVHLRWMSHLEEIEGALDYAYASGDWGYCRGDDESTHPPVAMAGLFRAITRAGNAGVMRHRTEYARHRASAARRLERAGAMRREGWSPRFVSVMIAMARMHRLMAEHWALYVRTGGGQDALEGHGWPDRGWDRRRAEVGAPALRLTMFELEVEYEGLLDWVELFVSGGRMGEWRWWVCAESGVATRPRESEAHRVVMGGSEAPGKISGKSPLEPEVSP